LTTKGESHTHCDVYKRHGESVVDEGHVLAETGVVLVDDVEKETACEPVERDAAICAGKEVEWSTCVLLACEFTWWEVYILNNRFEKHLVKSNR
jgi:hypothetical protein